MYCNGFTEGYKNFDKKIRYSTDKLIFPSIKECRAAIDEYIEELEDRNNCPTQETGKGALFRDYLLDLGEQEGAMVRFLEYKQKYEERIEEKEKGENVILKDLLINLNEQEKNILLEKINNYLHQKKRKGKAIAILIKALQINSYLLESDKRISLYSAIDKLVDYDTGTRASKDQYLRHTSTFDIEEEAKELSKVIRVNRNELE
ncbi:MAG: hypothetical protein LUG96_14655 [Tannerellaceae bacterium]|nr:hypothetical protein [Tannerellaceae bacterium]